MRSCLLIVSICIGILSCSKEENIPFIAADTDTLKEYDYPKIDGRYKGTLSDIELMGNQYLVKNSYIHYVDVIENSFHSVLIKDISNNYKSDAEAELFRLDKSEGYLSFIPASMADSSGIDSVYYSNYFREYFNGSFEYKDSKYKNKKIQYFFKYYTSKDTIHQYFEGYIQN
jgi:hypothetical protein